MKRISNQTIYDPFTDDPFKFQHPTEKEIIPTDEGGDGKEKRFKFVDLDTIHAIRTFVNSYGRLAENLSFEESAHATSIFQALKKSKNAGFAYIDIDESDYDWMLDKFKATGTKVFGLNAQVVYAAFRTRYEEPTKIVAQEVVEAVEA